MLKQLYRIVPLPFITILLVSGLERASAEETLIDAQCQPNPPINQGKRILKVSSSSSLSGVDTGRSTQPQSRPSHDT